MNAYLIFLVTSVLVGAIAAFIAHKTNRDVLTWFLAGLALNALVFVGLLVLRRKEAVSR